MNTLLKRIGENVVVLMNLISFTKSEIKGVNVTPEEGISLLYLGADVMGRGVTIARLHTIILLRIWKITKF